MPYFIAIDIGTTHCKAIVTTDAAEVLFETKAGYPSFQPQSGYHEQDPEQIFAAVMKVLRDAVDTVADKENILAVSFSAAMHSLIAVDKEGKPLTSLWTWADTRSISVAAELKDTPEGRRIHQQTGTPVHPMSPLCKIAWMKQEMPETFAATHKFISGKEYIVHQLTGVYEVDIAMASATGLLDVQTLQWSTEALAFAGITAAHLSSLVQPTDRLPALLPSLAEKLTLPLSVPFLHGGSDGSLANTGAGAVLPGEAALTIGTSGAIRILQDHSIADAKSRLFNYRLDKDVYLPGGAINNGGILLEWFIKTFTDNNKTFDQYLSELMPQADTIPAGAEGLIFLPYVYGERAPVWDAGASGMFAGIKAIHTRAHYFRAVLEGVGFGMKQVLEALEENGVVIHTLFAGGGFVESPEWLQIVTDILQKPVRVSLTADASSMGAVFMAMKAQGIINDWAEVKRFMREEELYQPGPFLPYQSNFAIFSSLYKPSMPKDH
ncbi:gluconokinase [Terrimonas sp. NA20]|uniref:Gluconokinase n=1 Tax=Terrimonas ginsenosidimutans TaxID=2908004 RepID=A0ABS9KZ25_9BACT|nr:gluconokinase [Terrimonas ginsenosidimutans]MCG2617565.1 gluconokinase [Terrimonas ginsenosidimutans]